MAYMRVYEEQDHNLTMSNWQAELLAVGWNIQRYKIRLADPALLVVAGNSNGRLILRDFMRFRQVILLQSPENPLTTCAPSMNLMN